MLLHCAWSLSRCSCTFSLMILASSFAVHFAVHFPSFYLFRFFSCVPSRARFPFFSFLSLSLSRFHSFFHFLGCLLMILLFFLFVCLWFSFSFLIVFLPMGSWCSYGFFVVFFLFFLCQHFRVFLLFFSLIPLFLFFAPIGFLSDSFSSLFLLCLHPSFVLCLLAFFVFLNKFALRLIIYFCSYWSLFLFLCYPFWFLMLCENVYHS